MTREGKRKKTKKFKIKKAAGGFSLIFFLLIFFGGAFYFLEKKFEGQVLPGTFAADLNLSGLSKEAAERLIEEKVKTFSEEPVVVIFQNQTFEFGLEELGLKIDLLATLAEIPVVESGRQMEFVKNLVFSHEIRPRFSLDREEMERVLKEKLPLKEGQSAWFDFDETGSLVVKEGENRTEVDFDQFEELLREKMENLNSEALLLLGREIPPLITADLLEEYRAKVEEVLKEPLLLEYEEKDFSRQEWKIDWISYPGWLDFETEIPVASLFAREIEEVVKIKVNSEKVAEYAAQNLSPEIDVPSSSIKIYYDENGKIVFEGEAVNGRVVRSDVLAKMLELALNHNFDLISSNSKEPRIQKLDLPVQEIKAKVEAAPELEALGIKELAAVGYSSFYGSPANRNWNIGVGLSRFNGLLVPPGETFSFGENLGVVDASTGYRKELVIREGETIPEFGGGLCQVSSTLFRAAFLGGFPIPERKEHTYAVTYYAYPLGWGLDATIYPPSVDLKFTNDTAHYLLIQAYAKGVEAYFKFYGESDGRKVELDGPYLSNWTSPPEDVIEYTPGLPPGERKKTDSAHSGFDATWYRTVTYPDGRVVEERWPSHYQAWPNKYLVGEGEELEGEEE